MKDEERSLRVLRALSTIAKEDISSKTLSEALKTMKVVFRLEQRPA